MKEKLEKVSNYLKANLRVKVLMGALILGLVITALGYTYALFTVQVEKKNAFTIIVTNLNYTLESSALNDQKQITVEAGGKQTFDITVTNPNEKESHFKLFYLGTTDENVVVSYTPNEVYPDGLGTLPANGSTTFTITIENKSSSSVTITLGCQGGLKDRELTLKQGRELTEGVDVCGPKPNAPILVQGQIPVTYSKEKSSWVKADISSEWYNYCNQEWANAVTVKETGTKTREEYMSAEAGTEISMDDINTMWVWIPRYEYMYTNLGTNYAGGTKTQPGEIKVKFIEGKGTTPSDSVNYKVHPAFTFGEDELEGLWYAKFETTGTLASACSNTSCNVSTVTVKPGITSLRSQTVSSFFYMSRSMQMNNASTYGFSTTDSDLHMSKNSEWGSVTYLSQSRYGKYGNPNYEGVEKEVRINNCSSFITGIGADSQNAASTTATCTTNTYETTNGMAASTTGNITGIYDMSGGAWEYVMGYLTTASSTWGATSVSNYAGFTSKPEDKYFDGYTSATSTIACNNGVCFGHALSETASWYSDYAAFVSASYPWFNRGGDCSDSTNAGVFNSGSGSGDASDDRSSRLVQAPSK